MSDPSRQLGPYRLTELIGVGGMAEVWAGLDGQGQPVAVKVFTFDPAEPERARARFLDEARICRALRHPHVVRLLDAGTDGHLGYLVFERLPPRTLADVPGALAPGLVVALGRQLLEGLAHAHAARGDDGAPLGIVHRDIKPSNLIVTDEGTLKIIDFGIALGRQLERTRTRTGAIRGSLPYISPEQAKNAPVDARSDLFSSGLVLHELLTGRPVFDQEDAAALITAVLWGPIPPVRSVRPDVPEPLARVISALLKKDPAARPASAAEAADLLRASLPPEEIWTPPRIAAWARAHEGPRRRSTAGTATLATVAPPGATPSAGRAAADAGAGGDGGRARRRRALIALSGALALAGSGAILWWKRPQAAAPAGLADATLPLHAAFYAASFPAQWGERDRSPLAPTLGQYDSLADAVIDRHLAAFRHGGLDAGIVLWRGIGATSDVALGKLLAASAGGGVRWTLSYEPEAIDDPEEGRIAADLAHLAGRHTGSPAFLRLGSRPVLFVHTGPNDDCGLLPRWRRAGGDRFFLVVKVFRGYRQCTSQPDGWYQRAPESPLDLQRGHSVTISPGYWSARPPRQSRPRSLEGWRQDVRRWRQAAVPFRLVDSFNNWVEGTAVESGTDWPSPSGFGAYLDALRPDGD